MYQAISNTHALSYVSHICIIIISTNHRKHIHTLAEQSLQPLHPLNIQCETNPIQNAVSDSTAPRLDTARAIFYWGLKNFYRTHIEQPICATNTQSSERNLRTLACNINIIKYIIIIICLAFAVLLNLVGLCCVVRLEFESKPESCFSAIAMECKLCIYYIVYRYISMLPHSFQRNV